LNPEDFAESGPTTHFEHVILTMFQHIHIDVVRKPAPSPTALSFPATPHVDSTVKENPLSLPPEILDAIAYYCSIPLVWKLAYSLCNMSIYHLHLRRRVRRSLSTFFSNIDTFYQCMHESQSLVAGKLVWKLIHCGNWSECNLKLILPYPSWLFVESYLLREGYEGDQSNAQLIAQRHGLQTLIYRKGDYIVSAVLFEPRRRMTPLQIISQHNFTSFMCYLAPRGFVVPFSQLTFASCAAVQQTAFLDTNPPIDQALADLHKVQCDPFTIGNKLITTRHLPQLCNLSTEHADDNMTWTVHWGPYF